MMPACATESVGKVGYNGEGFYLPSDPGRAAGLFQPFSAGVNILHQKAQMLHNHSAFVIYAGFIKNPDPTPGSSSSISYPL